MDDLPWRVAYPSTALRRQARDNLRRSIDIFLYETSLIENLATFATANGVLAACPEGNTQAMPQVDLQHWQVEALRHSTFVREPMDLSSVSLWEPLLGQPPAERTSRPREHLVKGGRSAPEWLADRRSQANPN